VNAILGTLVIRVVVMMCENSMSVINVPLHALLSGVILLPMLIVVMGNESSLIRTVFKVTMFGQVTGKLHVQMWGLLAMV
jgi:hypothetical protein